MTVRETRKYWAWLFTDHTLILAALILALACFWLGERVTVNDGLGWDGVIYAGWAKDFHEEVFVKRVEPYYMQRILPSAVVHYAMRGLQISMTDDNIIRAFGFLNVVLITLMAWLWCGIAGVLAISPGGRWLGLVGFFVNYIILKHTFFCPITTDMAAYAIGAAMLFCYLTGRTAGLVAVLLAGAFVWPSSVYVGALLLVFPRESDDVQNMPASLRGAPWRLNVILAGLGTALALVGILYVVRKPPTAALLVDPIYLEPIAGVVYLSLAVALLYLFLGAAALLDCDRLFAWRWLVTRRRAAAGFLVLLLLLGVRLLQYEWSNKQVGLGVQTLLPQTAFAAVAKPGVFLVTHVAYYGPMVLLTMWLWRPVCRLLHQYGVGLALAVLAGLVLSLNSQSRFTINIFALLIPFVVKATDDLHWDLRQYAFFASLSVVFSKVWLTINRGPFHGNLLEFPDQLLFMSHGPWISTSMYLAQGAAIVVGGFLLYKVCLSTPRQMEVIISGKSLAPQRNAA
jgi:hypothetical protein